MDYCSKCKIKACFRGNREHYPPFCPSNQECTDCLHLYEGNDQDMMIAVNAAIVEKEGYGVSTRIEDMISFFKKCGCLTIGVAYCIGLKYETEIICRIFEKHGFTVHSSVCKCGGTDKTAIGLEENMKLKPGSFEAMCNPIGQALYLNEMSTDYNVLIGLCVGHDSLVIKYSESPVTILAAKDRVTGHNPLVPVYLINSYYKRLLDF